MQMGQSTSAGSASSSVPYTGKYRDQIMSDAQAYAKAQPGAHDRNLNSMTTNNWSKYEARIRRQDLEKFRAKYKALQSAVFNLQEERSADVGKWLQAKLLLDTLEDYQSTEMFDALAFEIVVTDAIAGIGSTPKGKAILDTLITQWDPVQPGSLVWRVFAMNRADARGELGQMLKTAQAKKDVPLETAPGQGAAAHGPGVTAVVSAAGMIGKLNGYYKNLASLALEKDPKKISPLGGLFKRLEVDVFGMTVGDAIYARFRVNKIGDFVGEKIIQTLFLERAGVSDSDAIMLVRKQAELEKLSRTETVRRLMMTRKVMRSGAPPNDTRATKELYDVWNGMKSADDGAKQLRSARIAVVAALLEAVNFYKILTDAPDKDTRLKLVQSGASMLSSVITITMSPYYAALKSSVRSMSWKWVGGGLSAFGTFISAWMDFEKAYDGGDKDQYDTAVIYLAKMAGGMAVGIATLIDATSAAAPLLKKLAVRYGTDVVIEAVETATERVVAWA
ncbi:MAG TPA: T6SS effector BTH_I2691 family protein, partial [Paraburkholderia sp.]|nr:T6SS effector BTH_I2691 family protein [Paraburkholderia sp.]